MMASSRKLLTGLFLASTILAISPALAQVPEAPTEDPTEAEEVSPPQSPEDSSQPGDIGDPPTADQTELGEDIVVRGRYIPDEKRETSEIVSLLSAEDIARGGDSDIAGALTRVTGLSLVEGRFVYVRGLGGRYSSTLLDGSTLPSPEPLRRVTPLDVFPTDLLSGALIQKTYSVEFPGEFGGGLVALRARAVPERNFFEIGVSTGYNSESTFEDGLLYRSEGVDFLGFRNGSFDLPLAIRTNPSLTGFNAQQLQLAGRNLVERGPGMSIDSGELAPDVGFDATVGQRFDVGGMSAGVVAAVSYSNEFRNENGVRNSYRVGLTGVEPTDQFSAAACADFQVEEDSCGVRQTDNDITLGGLISAGLQINDQHALKATTILVRKANRVAELIRGQRPSSDAGRLVNVQRLSFVEQELWFNQLSGEHEFTLGGALTDFAVNWRGSYSRGSRVSPYESEFTYRLDDADDTVFQLSTEANGNSFRFSSLTDHNYEGGIDLALEGEIGGMATVVKLGGVYTKKERGFASRRYAFSFGGLGDTGELRSYVPEIIFSPDNIGPGGLVLQQTEGPSNSYVGEQEVWGVYGGLELQLIDAMRATAGVRYERSDQTLENTGILGALPVENCAPVGDPTGTIFQPLSCNLTQDFFLPAVTLTWEFARNMQLRGGYSRTIARPDLFELSTAQIRDPSTGDVLVGNPDLQITQLDNFDARYEWYFARDQIFTLGGFYKKFQNPIEQTLFSSGESGQISFINAESAELYGAEVELELTVPFGDWLGGTFFEDRRFFVIGNGTYVHSEVTIDPADAGILTSTSRRLQGQSEWLANVQVGYEMEGERLALLVNYTGDRISQVGAFGAPDVLETPPLTLDFTFAKAFPIGAHEVELGFRAENLLDEDYKERQGGFISEQYDLGRSFSIGLKARLR